VPAVSGIPKEVPDLGKVSDRLRVNPEFDPTRHGQLTAEEYFVLSRIDGYTSTRDVILMMGLSSERTIEILSKLRRVGAVLVAGETPASVAGRLQTAPGADASAEAPAEPAAPEVSLEPLSDAEAAAMADAVDLSDAEKRRVIAMRRTVESGDYFALLGVGPDVDKRELKRAYFRISKEFHPDRYYGRSLGAFGDWLASIFETAHEAFEILANRSRRVRYEAHVSGRAQTAQLHAETPKEHARALFERGCAEEASGAYAEALRLLSAAVHVDPRPRYLRRAASCAVAAGELPRAEEYAKRAADLQPRDPSFARALADVYRAGGKLRAAEKVLVAALSLPADSDALAADLRADLIEVRRRLDEEAV
jgi:tetratricopeptide (TPR) repeat protein